MIRILIFAFVCLLGPASLSQVRLPSLISDGMVLQRNADVIVWGWARPGERVSLEFIGNGYETTTGSDGKWQIPVPTEGEGGPFSMTIRGTNEIIIRDILLGDVWVCSGQSNMELPMRRVRPLYEREIAAAENNFIRYFQVPKTYNFNAPQETLNGGAWQHTTPQNVLDFSAAAYFFADFLNRENQVPIGLILTALGGSPVEAWMSEEALKSFPSHYQEALKFRDGQLIDQIQKEDGQRIGNWYSTLNQADLGYKQPLSWREPAYDDKYWERMNVPGYWKDTPLGNINGVVWFRKEITIPPTMAGKPGQLNLGRIVDADSVFINGTYVGSTGYQYPPRWYDVPPGVLVDSINTVAVRIINQSGNGGFVMDKPYVLVVENDSIPLDGEWKFKLGKEMEPLASQTFIRWKPMGLFNAMIAPLLNYRIKGVIWYQGESNTDNPSEYAELFPAMIHDWRKHWGDFPFLFVQLANFLEPTQQPGESQWAELREAQRHTLSVPNTGMATAIDIGEWNDIHPLNKKDVGVRLGLAAQKVAYHKEITAFGPQPESLSQQQNRLIIEFSSTGSGMTVRGGTLNGFAVAGADGKYEWAEAHIEGTRVIISSNKVPHPVSVRYAWADNPASANLYNLEGLPAPSFEMQVDR